MSVGFPGQVSKLASGGKNESHFESKEGRLLKGCRLRGSREPPGGHRRCCVADQHVNSFHLSGPSLSRLMTRTQTNIFFAIALRPPIANEEQQQPIETQRRHLLLIDPSSITRPHGSSPSITSR